MVKKKISISVYEWIKNTKSYLSEAFYAACTINPFDIDRTKFTYLQPIILLGLISIPIAIVATLMSVISLTDDFFVTYYSYMFAYSTILSFLLHGGCFSLSFIGCKILRLKFSALHFGIIVSSFIPTFLIVVLYYIIHSYDFEYVLYIVFSKLMSYYVRTTYYRYFNMISEKNCICILCACAYLTSYFIPFYGQIFNN